MHTDTCYTTVVMKSLLRPTIIILASLAIAFVSAAVTFTPRVSSSSYYSATAAYFLQNTPNLQEEDRSVVGSTDGIVVMGGIIVLIVLVPVLLKRGAWKPAK